MKTNQTREHQCPKKRIMVLGGRGFIGRHVVQHLNRLGHDVRIGTRHAEGQVGHVNVAFHTTTLEELRDQLQGVEVIINAVGILRQRVGETYEAVHHTFVQRLATVCAELNIRLVHVSALGLNNRVKSRFLTSKRRGEAAVKASGADWRIVRPSLIDGEGGYGAKWFRRVAHWPIHCAPNNARGRLRPIHVMDLAEAIIAIALLDNLVDESLGKGKDTHREFELGGADETDVLGYLALLKGRPPKLAIRIPNVLARLASHMCDLFHITPLSFGHYELLKYDNCPEKNRLVELIGRTAGPLGGCPVTEPLPDAGRRTELVKQGEFGNTCDLGVLHAA